MKTTSLIFAIILGLFGIFCAVFYFILFYSHLAIFALFGFILSFFMFRDLNPDANSIVESK